MSIPLKNINLSSAVVGQTFVIDLTPIGQSAGAVSSDPSTLKYKAHLGIHNESGCSIQLSFDVGSSGKNIPAGAWRPISLEPGTSKVLLNVQSIMPNAPISIFFSEYYFPGEPVDDMGKLGNSPIGVTGSVTTTVSALQTIPAVQFTPNNDTLAAGGRNSYQVSFPFAGGIPAGTTFVLINLTAFSAINGSYFSVGPKGFTPNGNNFPQMVTHQTTFIDTYPSLIVPVDTTSGQIDLVSAANAFTNINGWVYGFYK